jgi:predicted amidohydrolase
MVTRCLENRVFAITTNRYGTETLGDKRLTFTGASQLMSPLGERLLQAPVDGDCVLLAEIDPTLADNKRPTTRNDLLADRRPEHYA